MGDEQSRTAPDEGGPGRESPRTSGTALVAGTGAAPGKERRAGGKPSRDVDAPPPDRTGTHRPGHRRDGVARLPERPRDRAHARGQPGRTG